MFQTAVRRCSISICILAVYLYVYIRVREKTQLKFIISRMSKVMCYCQGIAIPTFATVKECVIFKGDTIFLRDSLPEVVGEIARRAGGDDCLHFSCGYAGTIREEDSP